MNQESVMEVGNTPLVCIDGVFAKLECVNPTGSIKDRMAKFIIEQSEQRGLLKPGMTIVEATSGNTGIALSCFGRQKGYDVVIIMPEDMTEERKELIRSFGAKLVLCSPEGSFSEAVRIRDEMVKDRSYFTTDQFSNELNGECHYRTTGQEIIRQLGATSRIPDAFVAGVGTGGTLMGVARALREVNPEVHIAAVEPAESPVMSGGVAAHHGIQGIGDGFVPDLVKGEDGRLSPLIDEVIHVSSNEAIREARFIAMNRGYCVGVSSGANVFAAKDLMSKFDCVVTVLPDGFNRYASVGLSSSNWCEYHGVGCRTAHAEAPPK
jgi:cysteine synthase A